MLLNCHLYSQVVTPWVTTGDKTKLLQQQSGVNFSSNTTSGGNIITINPAVTYQNVDGFGFCLTEGSAEVISTLNVAQQDALLNELFNLDNGLGISVLRISVGASDLSSSNYSYNEMSGDDNMINFSLSGPDLTYLIPILKKIITINPDIKILATPWSPPRWMKSNNSWIGGSLNSSAYAAYANYFVKYITEMKLQGINIWAVTPQNEPENPNNNPSMTLNSTEEKNFINNNLGPALAAAGYSLVKIIAFDHNCDNTTYPIDVCNNSTFVDGAAFHLYAGNISAMSTVRNATGKNVYFTEQYTASNGNFSGDFGWHMQNVIIGSLNNWSKTVLEWNLANNSAIGPNTTGGCTTCLGAITINNSTSFTRNVSYYIIGQASKFVKPNAVRLLTTSGNSSISAVSLLNTNGIVSLLCYNSSSSSQSVKIVEDSNAFNYTLPGNSAVTFTWKKDGQNVLQSVNTDSNLKILYNSSSNKVYLTFPFTYKPRVELFSTNGSLLYSQNADSETFTSIPTYNLMPGLYLVRIFNSESNLTTAFIKS